MQRYLTKEALEELQLILEEDYAMNEMLTDEELMDYGNSYIELGKDMLKQFKFIKATNNKIYANENS